MYITKKLDMQTANKLLKQTLRRTELPLFCENIFMDDQGPKC